MIFFFSCYRDHLPLHSFPTRRSSDLLVNAEHGPCFLQSKAVEVVEADEQTVFGFESAERERERFFNCARRVAFCERAFGVGRRARAPAVLAVRLSRRAVELRSLFGLHETRRATVTVNREL